MNKLFVVWVTILLLPVISYAETKNSTKNGQEHEYIFETFQAGGINHLLLMDKRTGDCWEYATVTGLNNANIFTYVPKSNKESVESFYSSHTSDTNNADERSGVSPNNSKPQFRDLRNSSEEKSYQPN